VERPHEGLLSLRRAILAFVKLASLRDSSAPLLKASLTSSPMELITLAFPVNRSPPSPPTILAGGRGVDRPPNCSGQKGMIFIDEAILIIPGDPDPLPSNLQDISNRQALIKTGKFCNTSAL
jgi:hypothetical protein